MSALAAAAPRPRAANDNAAERRTTRSYQARYNPATWIRPLADAEPSHGAKAFGLARLIAAGLPVPDGFVLDARALRETAAMDLTELAAIGDALDAAAHRIEAAELPAELDREVRACAAALGRLAVRSSASLEDSDLGAAAGVFASVTDVAPAEVWSAIRAVWLSALTPLAAAYARA